MTLDEVQPGDTVYLTRTRHTGEYSSISRRTVKKVRKYKVRTKITLNDGSEWCSAFGVPWHSQGYYGGPRLELPTEEIEKSLTRLRVLSRVKWILDNFGDLSEDQVETIGAVVQRVTSELVGPGRDPRISSGVS